MERAIAEVIRKGEKVTYDLKPTRDDPTAVGTSRVRRRRDRGDEPVNASTSQRHRYRRRRRRSATRCCSASPAARCSATTRRCELSLLEIPQAVKAAEGVAMELDDCAFPLLARHRHLRRPEPRLRRRATSRCWWARARAQGHGARRPARGQRRHLQAAGRGASTTTPPTTCACSWSATRRTRTALIAMSNAPDVPRERFTAMMRLDHNRAIAQLAKKAGARVADITEHDDLGQPLGHPVPRHLPREGQRRERAPRRWTTRRGSRTTSSRPCGSAARRSSRRAAPPARRRRRTRRSTTCATGCSAPPRATGSRWPSPPTAPTASRRGSSPSFPVTMLGRRVRDRPGPRHQRLLAPRIDATVDELQGARRGASSASSDAHAGEADYSNIVNR